MIDGVGTEDEILGQIRSLVSLLPSNNEDTDNYTECTDDLNRVCADLANCAGDTAIALPRSLTTVNSSRQKQTMQKTWLQALSV